MQNKGWTARTYWYYKAKVYIIIKYLRYICISINKGIAKVLTNNLLKTRNNPMHLYRRLCYAIIGIFVTIGALFSVGAIIAFTTAPFWGMYWLGTSKAKQVYPDKIVLLGGGGMPSESNLMRLWYSIEEGHKYPDAQLILAIPGDTTDNESAICKIAEYAVERGINWDRIRYEPNGGNTRAQALNIFNDYYSDQDTFLLVTSPEHLRRSVLTFQKAGFTKLGGIPAFPVALEGNLIFSESQTGKTATGVPEIGDNLQVRYQFWNHLIYEIVLMREYCALMYYKINGWI